MCRARRRFLFFSSSAPPPLSLSLYLSIRDDGKLRCFPAGTIFERYPIAFIDLVQRRWLPLFHESATVNSGMSIERPMKNKRDDFVSCLGEEEEEEGSRLRGLVKEVQEEDKGRSIFKVKWKTDYNEL